MSDSPQWPHAHSAPLDAIETRPSEPQNEVFLPVEVIEPQPLVESPAPVEVSHYRPLLAQGARSPNIVDAFLFGILLILGLLITTGFLGVALYFHWFGLRSFAAAQNDTRLALVTQLVIYLVALAGAVPLFRMVWGRSYLGGLHWHAETALRHKGKLVLAAVGCNLIAVLGNYLLPFPEHAPIDKMFGSAGDAWMLFAFGVTVAPFFEEMMFRGFLLPAIATAWDWSVERMTGAPSRGVDAAGNPLWSGAAMVVAALVVSAPFALMHAAQVGNSWGPVSLLYCVSLVLCAVRLWTKSLAASTLVHAAYNFMIFSVMLVGTDGFRHLDKV